ncbi:MAG: phosphoglucosamine mutase [Deltaproteobacteria bacterium]|nr:MAG: phosphoglucosamine mutase [Deltaproteobacteria bacterium]
MKKLFGTDGIRGVANEYPMTGEVAMALGRALAHVFYNGHKPHILIGKDTRLSGYMIENALAAGACSGGADVFLVGPMPTPGIAFLTGSMRAIAGVMISASHNPYQDNGIKVFDSEGFKLPDETERKIEQLVLNPNFDSFPVEDRIGRAKRIDDARGRYIEFIKSTFPKNLSLEDLHLVVDCAHGATYQIAPVIFEELGAQVTVLNDKPNGKNINHQCGAVHPQAMAQKVKDVGADLGIALDGDGDRVIFSDEHGNVIDGDAIMAICAEDMIQKGQLKDNTLVATVMSNQGLEEYIRMCGGKLIRTQVGDRYVVEAMRQNHYNFGGENSGHLVFLDHSRTGDGIVAALQVLRIMLERRSSLFKLVSRYKAFPQVLTGVKVKERRDLQGVSVVQDMIKTFEQTLGQEGRVLVRYSGTEPLVRVMIEGKNNQMIQKMALELSECIQLNLA